MEERRLLLAVALSLLVLTAYRYFFTPPQAPRPADATATTSPPAPAPSAASSAPPTAVPPSPSPSPSAVPTVADERERRVEVDGRELTVAFTNRGARLLSWRLKRFTDRRGRPEEMVQTVPDGPRPLDVETGDAAIDAKLRTALFRASAEMISLDLGQQTLSFEFAEGDLSAAKTFRFGADGYLVEVDAVVRRAGQELPRSLLWGPGVGNPTPEEMEVQGYLPPHAVALVGQSVERLSPEKLATPVTVSPVRWVGVESTYFAALFVPPGGQGRAELRAAMLPATEGTKAAPAPVTALPLGQSPGPALLFVGPKDHSALTKLDHELARVVNVGDWIGPLVVPLMALLRWVHTHVGNYGWSIVALTVLINLAMAPFRHYSIANGLKMAKLAPEMKVIQERYRKVPALDPKRQEMQKEVAALYARHGMSMGTQMMVGCLPLLLTMPFLIAFYRVLQVSIELRGADFLWISDLSQKDPLFVTPLFMGLSMFVMQKMTPTAMDPAQQRIMMIMPLMLMGMFLWAPAGLNLYWLASNVCSIIQQGVTLSLLRRSDAGNRKEQRKK
jgi:YidC/Oxa1 family membrane protein insertase